MKFITRFFKQFIPQKEYQYVTEITAEEISEIIPIQIQDEVLERTDLYLRDHRYKTALYYAQNDLNKSQESSPIPRHPRPFSS